MNAPTTRQVAVGALVAAGVVAAILAGQVTPAHPTPAERAVTVSRPGWDPTGATCYDADAVLSPAQQQLGTLLADGGRSDYAVVSPCAHDADAGVADERFTILPGSRRNVRPAQPGDPELRIVMLGASSAGFLCRCGPGCVADGDGGTRTWAELGRNTLGPGTPWSTVRAPDAGPCLPTPCSWNAGDVPAQPECL